MMNEKDFRDAGMMSDFTRDSALRDEIMTCRYRYITMNASKNAWAGEREHVLSQLLGSKLNFIR